MIIVRIFASFIFYLLLLSYSILMSVLYNKKI